MSRTIHQIAVSMTADMGQALREFDNVDKSIKKLEATQKRLKSQGLFSDAIQKDIADLKTMQTELGKVAKLRADPGIKTDLVRNLAGGGDLKKISEKINTLQTRLKSAFTTDPNQRKSMQEHIQILQDGYAATIKAANGQERLKSAIGPTTNLTRIQEQQLAGLDNLIRILTIDEARLEKQFADTTGIRQRIAELHRMRNVVLQVDQGSRRMAAGTRVAGASMRGAFRGNGRLTQGFSQLAFGVEDFMSVVDTMGVRGGLRAAGNNLSMVARIMAGPVIGGLFGIALVAGPALIAWLTGAEKKFKDTTKAIKGFDKAQRRLADGIQGQIDQFRKLREIGKIDTSDEFIEQQKEIRGALQDTRGALSTIGPGFQNLADTLQKDLLKTQGGLPLFDSIQEKLKGSEGKAITKDMAESMRVLFVNAVGQFNRTVASGGGVGHAAIDLRKAMGKIRGHLDESGATNDRSTIWWAGGLTGTLTEAGKAARSLDVDIKSMMDRMIPGGEQGESAFSKLIQSGIDKQKELAQQQADGEGKINNLLEQRIELQKRLLPVAKDSLKAIQDFNKNDAQLKLDALEAEQAKLAELEKKALAGTGRFPGAIAGQDIGNAMADALDKSVKDTITDLEAMLPDTDFFKGQALVGDSLMESTNTARLSAQAQMRAAKKEKIEIPRQKVVDAINDVKTFMSQNRLYVAPVP